MPTRFAWLKHGTIRNSFLIASGVFVVALIYVATRPWFDPGYGIEPISVGNGKKLYLKRLDSGAVGPEGFWLSENPHRCAGFPDKLHDYVGNPYDNGIWYRVSDGKLIVYDYKPWQSPSSPPNIPVEFVPIYDKAAHQMIPLYGNIERDQVRLGVTKADVKNVHQCSVFPDGLLDGTWHDWFN